MKKLSLFLLVCLLCVSHSVQKKGKNKGPTTTNNHQKNVSVDQVLRVFKGLLIGPTDELIPLDGTEAPITPPSSSSSSSSSPLSPPALRLLSNSTAAFLRGALSTRLIPVVYVLCVAVGIPANVAILASVAAKVRKVSSAILYCSLAVSDLLLLLSLFFKAHYHLHGNHWVLGEAACRVVTACFYGNLYCSALTLACISVKRYLAVVHPFTYKCLPKRTYTAGVTLAVWGAFAAAMLPELLVRQSYRVPEVGAVTCHDVLPLDDASHGFLLYYHLLLTLLGLLLPLGVTVFCYARIVQELRRSHSDWGNYIRAFSLVFAIFVLCFAPAGLLHLLHVLQLFVSGAESLYVAFKVAACLCCVHACLDPFLFVLMSESAGSRLYFRALKGKKTLSISF